MGLNIKISWYYAMIGLLFIVSLGGFEVFAVNLAHLVDNSPNTGNVTLLTVGILISAAFMGATLLVAASQRLRRNPQMQAPVEIDFDSEKSRRVKVTGKSFTLTLQLPTALIFLAVFLNDSIVEGIEWVGWVAFGMFFVFLFVGAYGIYRVLESSSKQPIDDNDRLTS